MDFYTKVINQNLKLILMRYQLADISEAIEYTNHIQRKLDSKRIFIFDIRYDFVRIQIKSLENLSITTVQEYCPKNDAYRYLQGYNSAFMTFLEGSQLDQSTDQEVPEANNTNRFTRFFSLLKKLY